MTIRYHPCSKEFQDDAKRLGLTGNQYIKKLVQEGKLPYPSVVDKKVIDNLFDMCGVKDYGEYKDYLARRKGHNDNKEFLDNWANERGFDNYAEYQRIKNWNNGTYSPISEGGNFSSYLGICIVERIYARKILPLILCDVEKEMPPNYQGFDVICVGGIKVQIKSRTLERNRNTNSMYWKFGIDCNKIADYFLLIAFDTRENLNMVHAWLIKKDESIRQRRLNQFISLGITNNRYRLLEFQKYDIIDKIDKDLLKNIRYELDSSL